MPEAKARPARLTTLSVRPKASITRKTVTSEVGIETATTSIERSERRKSSSTATDSSAPCHRLLHTKSRAWFR